jgi:hypothetical protein
MSCRILETIDENDSIRCAIFYCSTTGWAFGPIMADREQAESFMASLEDDPRCYSEESLLKAWRTFLNAER